MWITIGNDGNRFVYDVTKYKEHPGGSDIFMEYAGGDADFAFEDVGHSQNAREEMKDWLVGKLKVETETKKKTVVSAIPSDKSKPTLLTWPLVVLGIILGFFAMKYI